MTMTAKDLMRFFEKYDGIFQDTMFDYLNGRSSEFYRAAANVLVRRVSRAYGKAPGHAEFEKHMDEIRAEMPERPALPREPEPEMTEEERAEGLRMLAEMKKIMGQKICALRK